MIPVVLAPEPPSFDAEVRRPGLSAIAELIGRASYGPSRRRRRKQIAGTEDEIPPGRFPPYWRKSIDEMMQAYDQRCAYLAMFIEATGNPTIDHVVPKSLAWNLVYEWSNYRLCTGVVNARKGALVHLVDPVHAKVGWFSLNLESARVVRGADASEAMLATIDATLPLLNLRDCVMQRMCYLDAYRDGPGAKGIDLTYLEHRAPFIAAELRRQGQLVRGDT